MYEAYSKYLKQKKSQKLNRLGLHKLTVSIQEVFKELSVYLEFATLGRVAKMDTTLKEKVTDNLSGKFIIYANNGRTTLY